MLPHNFSFLNLGFEGGNEWTERPNTLVPFLFADIDHYRIGCCSKHKKEAQKKDVHLACLGKSME